VLSTYRMVAEATGAHTDTSASHIPDGSAHRLVLRVPDDPVGEREVGRRDGDPGQRPHRPRIHPMQLEAAGHGWLRSEAVPRWYVRPVAGQRTRTRRSSPRRAAGPARANRADRPGAP
jgi:hypothetical protein